MLEFQMGRVKICLYFSFFLLLYFLLSVRTAEYLLVVLAAVFLHELGHLSALLCFSAPVRRICLNFTGIHIQKETVPLGLLRELCIHISGPAGNFILAAVAVQSTGFWWQYFAIVHLLLGILHLLPVGNLDGAHILHLLLSCVLIPDVVRKIQKLVSVLILLCTGVMLWHYRELLNVSAPLLWVYLAMHTTEQFAK